MSKFKIGDKVKWTRKSTGVNLTHRGVVIMTREESLKRYGCPKGNNPQFAAGDHPGPAHIKFNGTTWGHLHNDYDGVLVWVKPTERAWGQIYKPHFPYVELDE